MADDEAVALPEGCQSVEEVFEYGQCHALALALNAKTGWPIVGLYSPKLGDTNHYLVRRPDGQLVDVRGVRSEAEVLQQWDDNTGFFQVREYTPGHLWSEVHREDMEDPGDVWPLAQQVVSKLTADQPEPVATTQPAQACAGTTLDAILPQLENEDSPESKARLLRRTAEDLSYMAGVKQQQAENLGRAAAAYEERGMPDLASTCRNEAQRAQADSDRNEAEVRALNDVATELTG